MATSNRSVPNGSLREPSPEQPLSELISRTSSDLATLFRKEVELAKIEIRDDVRHTAKAGSMFGAAGFAGYLAVVLVPRRRVRPRPGDAAVGGVLQRGHTSRSSASSCSAKPERG